ncbi:hypothetical protein TNCV_2289421 [Trichonephila clavipes]|uniref:Tc1-like transposase DDE domain-containing protein n=1 Tax=Trichonephila clavipes TaxID=2585209 RepID=A0A8X6RNK6_TRICX|nr:hypothetical protein TNCV_2289421 [Trichonephila clavipes]
MQALSTRRAIGMRSWKPITRIVDEFDEGMDISRIVQPLRSPDLNPMELICDGLGKVVSQCSSSSLPPPNKLIVPLLEVWGLLPKIFIDTFINSMTAHYEACITVHSCHIPDFSGVKFFISDS